MKLNHFLPARGLLSNMEDYIKPWLDCMSPSLRRLYDIGKKKKDSQKKLRLLDTIFERSLGTDYPTTLEQI